MVQRSNRIILSSLATQWPILSRPDFSIGVRSLRRNLFSFDIYMCIVFDVALFNLRGNFISGHLGMTCRGKGGRKVNRRKMFPPRETLQGNQLSREGNSIRPLDRSRANLFIRPISSIDSNSTTNNAHRHPRYGIALLSKGNARSLI